MIVWRFLCSNIARMGLQNTTTATSMCDMHDESFDVFFVKIWMRYAIWSFGVSFVTTLKMGLQNTTNTTTCEKRGAWWSFRLTFSLWQYYAPQTNTLERKNGRVSACWKHFSRVEYMICATTLWKVLRKYSPNGLFDRPKSSFREHAITLEDRTHCWRVRTRFGLEMTLPNVCSIFQNLRLRSHTIVI